MQNINQIIASQPDLNIWLAANAGSGKTKVLTDRILRLLLNKTKPSNILALTFTNAAAGEMTARIMARLSKWAILSVNDLQAELDILLNREATSEELTYARQLFFYLTDNIEKLNIATLHSFSQSLLKKFPLEAELQPEFKIIDEIEENILITNAKNKLFAAVKNNNELLDDLNFIARQIKDFQIHNLISEIIDNKFKIFSLLSRYNMAEIENLYRQSLNIDNENIHEILQAFYQTHNVDIKSIALENLEKNTDKNLWHKLINWQNKNIDYKLNNFEQLREIFLTQKDQARAKLFTKDFAEKYPEFSQKLIEIQAEIILVNEKIKSRKIYELSLCLLRIAQQLFHIYEKIKKQNNVIDNNDVIFKTINLLHKNENCQWVLYNLDYHIEHILVDEAQDTSPEQWLIINKICEDFFAGQTKSEVNRTIFVVGDEKQSIYSFQGANPIYFSLMHDLFANKIQNVGKEWRSLDLAISYRSSSVILDLVDNIFTQEALAKNISFSDHQIKHIAFRKNENNYGKVELWPLIYREKNTEEDVDQSIFPEWKIPDEYNDKIDDISQILAQNIAHKIKDWFDTKHVLASKKRIIEPRDITILVRKRDRLVKNIIRECKNLGLAINGEDRINLSNHIIAKDLISILKVMMLPEDDMNLAIILKSPLFEISEDELMELAINRQQKSLYQYIKGQAQYDEQINIIYQKLELIINYKNLLPYEIISKLFYEHNLFTKYQEYYGVYVKDLIQEIFKVIIEFEQTKSINILDFINWFEASNIVIKRPIDNEQNAINIMTIHAAKGLQAPVIILADSTSMPNSNLSQIFWHENDEAFLPLYAASSKNYNEQVNLAKEVRKNADYAEYLRLLYVALTRAEDELYITGLEKNNMSEDCWYNIIKQAMSHDENVIELADKTLVIQNYIEENITVIEDEIKLTSDEPIPVILLQKYTQKNDQNIQKTLRVTENKLEKFQDNINNACHINIGLFTHKLLQFDQLINKDNCLELIDNKQYNISNVQAELILNNVAKIVQDNKIFFAEKSWAEVPIIFRHKNNIMRGVIDRLAIIDNKLYIIDYKTNRKIPKNYQEIPENYIKQLNLYKLAMAKIFPEMTIITYILWTANNSLQEIKELEDAQ